MLLLPGLLLLERADLCHKLRMFPPKVPGQEEGNLLEGHLKVRLHASLRHQSYLLRGSKR